MASRVDFSVILPTYNEVGNIGLAISELLSLFRRKKLKGEIIVVDDNSPDDTAKVAKEFARKHKNLKVIVRPGKLGLGGALATGYSAGRGKVLISIDADRSIVVEEIPRLLVEINKGCDFVVGSRYRKSIIDMLKSTHALHLDLIKKFGNKYLALATGIPMTDFALNCRAMKDYVWKKIKPKNHEHFFLVEMIIQAHKAGFSLKEINVGFHPRTFGESKTRVEVHAPIFVLNGMKIWLDRFLGRD